MDPETEKGHESSPEKTWNSLKCTLLKEANQSKKAACIVPFHLWWFSC